MLSLAVRMRSGWPIEVWDGRLYPTYSCFSGSGVASFRAVAVGATEVAAAGGGVTLSDVVVSIVEICSSYSPMCLSNFLRAPPAATPLA